LTRRIDEIEDFDIGQLQALTKELEDQAYSSETWKTYNHSWKQFKAWCKKIDASPLPAELKTIQAFLSWLVKEEYSWPTIERTVCAISKFHDLEEETAQTRHIKVKKHLDGIRRSIKTKSKSKNNLTIIDLASICQVAPDKPIWWRNRAILTIGFAGALRRSEVANLKVQDVVFMNDGAILNLWDAKGARRGEVQRVGVPMGQNEMICPIQNLRKWLAFTKATEGPLFLPMKPPLGQEIWNKEAIYKETVSQVVKRGVELIGLDSAIYGGHSLRRGLATAASQANVPLARLKQHTRHKSVQSLLPYIEDSELFADNPANLIGF